MTPEQQESGPMTAEQQENGMAGAPEGKQGQGPQAQGPQGQIADLTGRLEAEFAKQFQQNLVNQAALSRLISSVIQSFPEAARARVKIHIDEVFDSGQKAAGQMTPEERTKAVTPPPKEKLGKTQQGLITGWGWGGPGAFGGFGAFGFPGMYSSAALWPAVNGFYGTTNGFYGTGFGCGWGGAWCGTGLGVGGWYW